MHAMLAWLGAFWASFGACFAATRSARRACDLVGLAHHALVVVLAALAVAESPEIMLCGEGCFAATSRRAVELHDLNVGYFAYDAVLVAMYYPKFIAHHAIALCALSLLSWSGSGMLANTVTMLLTEIGGVAYVAYTLHRTRAAYATFVAFYALTRAALVVWTWRTVVHALYAPSFVYLAIAALHIALASVNVAFCAHHMRKVVAAGVFTSHTA